MWYNVHDFFLKLLFIIQENIRILKIKFWLWFEIVIILKDETLNLQGINTFKISYLFKTYKLKNVSCTWTIISIYYNNLQKNCSNIHLYQKVIFGWKNMKSFFEVTLLVSTFYNFVFTLKNYFKAFSKPS
jgi:hypothetical protein